MKLFVALTAGACALAFATPALAVGNPALGNAADGLQALRELNLIVLGNLTNGSHVQGKAYIGGDASFIEVGSGGSTYTSSDRAALTVGGSVSSFTVQSGVGSPASVRVGGNINGGNVNMNVDGHIDAGGSITGFNPNTGKTATANVAGLKSQIDGDTATLSNDLAALSLSLKSLPALATITSKASALNVSGAGDVAVFDMTEAAFEDGNDFDKLFAGLAGDLTVVINVLGSELDQNANFNAGAWVNEHVIWNFTQASTIDLTRAFHGSILGVDALLTNSTPIEGAIAVANFDMKSEVHLGTFQGPSPLQPGPSVPEPATWAMMLVGFGMVGAVARSRRRRTPAAA